MKKTITLRFNGDFYSIDSIKKGINDYRDVADFVVKTKGNNRIVSLNNFNDEVAGSLGDEFSNYVLFIESTKRV